jgi:hypothetical protein
MTRSPTQSEAITIITGLVVVMLALWVLSTVAVWLALNVIGGFGLAFSQCLGAGFLIQSLRFLIH